MDAADRYLGGLRIGRLHVLYQQGRCAFGALWFCRCECGSLTRVADPRLRRALAAGGAYPIRCRRCDPSGIAARSDWREEKRRRAYYRQLWESTGSLYSDADTANEIAALRDAMGRTLGVRLRDCLPAWLAARCYGEDGRQLLPWGL